MCSVPALGCPCAWLSHCHTWAWAGDLALETKDLPRALIWNTHKPGSPGQKLRSLRNLFLPQSHGRGRAQFTVGPGEALAWPGAGPDFGPVGLAPHPMPQTSIHT